MHLVVDVVHVYNMNYTPFRVTRLPHTSTVRYGDQRTVSAKKCNHADHPLRPHMATAALNQDHGVFGLYLYTDYALLGGAHFMNHSIHSQLHTAAEKNVLHPVADIVHGHAADDVRAVLEDEFAADATKECLPSIDSNEDEEWILDKRFKGHANRPGAADLPPGSRAVEAWQRIRAARRNRVEHDSEAEDEIERDQEGPDGLQPPLISERSIRLPTHEILQGWCCTEGGILSSKR
mmetsp:Transcript_2592/g.5627  ORF Transcript_2592/g.5627 Transcript_2592/m.5627 type:complete len:235 (-) Transcript_2592:67-771(-)